jgi:hypothetical protein
MVAGLFQLAREVQDRSMLEAYVRETLATGRRDLLQSMILEVLRLEAPFAVDPRLAARLECLRLLLRTQRPVPCSVLLAQLPFASRPQTLPANLH